MLMDSNRRRASGLMPQWMVFALLASGGFIGCGDSDRVPVYPVSGKVTLDGKPAAGARVTFLPVDATPDISGFHPGGKTDEEGIFRLRTYEKHDGAPEAKYLVLVKWPSPDRFAKEGDIPEEWDIIGEYYGDRDNPQFHANVTSDENPKLQFDLVTPDSSEQEEDEYE